MTEIERMIADHHKITPSRANQDLLVEPFRQADWIDVTWAENIRTSTSVDPLGARRLAERRVSLAPGPVDSRKIPHASVDALADGHAVMSTRSGADALPTERRELMFPPLVSRARFAAATNSPIPPVISSHADYSVDSRRQFTVRHR
jgi:hypothetical protein